LPARERTFEGAYVRTALNALGTGAVVLKLFSREFFSMGLIFIAFGVAMLVLGLLRRQKMLGQNRDVWAPFRTSGRYIVATASIAICAYTAMLVLVLRLDS
jgi:uncharacterized membrane protein YidH (DUF202 family)